jgi:hypothetical protein
MKEEKKDSLRPFEDKLRFRYLTCLAKTRE